MLGSGRGLKATQEHTTIMAIMDVCGGGVLACLITGGASSSCICTRKFRVTDSMDP